MKRQPYTNLNRRAFNPVLLIPTIVLFMTVILWYAFVHLAHSEELRPNFQDGTWMVYEIEPWTEPLGDRVYAIGTTWKFFNISTPAMLGWERSTVREPNTIVWQAWGPRDNPEEWWNALLIHEAWRACACAVDVVAIMMAKQPVVIEAVLADPEHDPDFPFLAIQGPFPLVPFNQLVPPLQSESPAATNAPAPRQDQENMRPPSTPSPAGDIRVPPRPKKRT